MEFSRPEYWSAKSLPSPGDLPNPGIRPGSPTLQQADSLAAEPQGKPKNTQEGSLSLLQWISWPRNLESPALQVNSLPIELSGEPEMEREMDRELFQEE